MTNIMLVLMLIFNLAYYKVLNIVKFTSSHKNASQVIFKADDLRGTAKNVEKLDKIVKKENIKISWGIIGNSMQTPSDKYISFLKEKKEDKNYHFFNHGYSHYCDHQSRGNSEFMVSPKQQIESLEKTQNLVKEKSGIVLDAFGAPCNYINKNTEIALNNFDEIKYWYFGLPSVSKTTIERIVNIEKTVGKPDIKFLKSSFEKMQKDNKKKDKKLITLQIHPYMWKKIDFLQFKVCVAYLKYMGAEFVTPDDL